MLDFLIIGILIFLMIYYLIVLESNPQHKIKPKQLEELNEIKKKLEPVYVYFKTIPEENDYVFKHDKLTERKKPDRKLYTHSHKQLYFSLNKILRHFYLTDDFNKKEIMTLTYIPDNFDFNSYINYKNLGSKSNLQFNTNCNSPFTSKGDTMELNNILPNDLAKVMFELDDNIEEMRDEMDNEINESDETHEVTKRTKITYKKNKITLKTSDNFFLNIKYTRFPKEEYDICAINDNIIESVLKLRKIPLELAKGQPLKKDKKKKQKFVYYIKFMNDYYLCINKDMILYASKDKNFIFYFDVYQLTPNEVQEISKLKI
jgi:hypothetical protein